MLSGLVILDFGCSRFDCPDIDELNFGDFAQLKMIIYDFNHAYGTPPISITELLEYAEIDAKDHHYIIMKEIVRCDDYSLRLNDSILYVYFRDSLFFDVEVFRGDVLYSNGRMKFENQLKELLMDCKKYVIDSIHASRLNGEVLYDREDLSKNRCVHVKLMRSPNDGNFKERESTQLEMLYPFLNVLNAQKGFLNIDSMEVVLYFPDTVPNRPPPPPSLTMPRQYRHLKR